MLDPDHAALRKRPQGVEILALDAVQENALTQGLTEKSKKILLVLASLLFFGGVQYLLIRSRNTKVCGKSP